MNNETLSKSKTAPHSPKAGSGRLEIAAEQGKSEAQQFAELATRGIGSNAGVLTLYSRDTFSDETSMTDAFKELTRLSEATVAGDLGHLERILGAQALSLNALYAGLAHRSKSNSQAGYLDAADTYLRLALRAQAQCRQTVQTLFEMKNPRPVAFVQQANISNGPQQVNNGLSNASSPARAEENAHQPNKLLEAIDGKWLDAGAQGSAGRANQDLAPVGTLDRPKDRNR
jgi:hypothetical protein